MADHANLGQGERGEQPDREQGNEGVEFAAEEREQRARGDGDGDDPVGEDQPITAMSQLSRAGRPAGEGGPGGTVLVSRTEPVIGRRPR